MLAQSAPELMLAAEHLLQRLQLWLQARNLGVLALELEWTVDLRRLNGVQLPAKEQLQVRTAKPTQDIAHLRRLVREHLERATLSAPANHLRLRSIDTVPWGGATQSLLPGEKKEGERLHELVERLSIRLGEDQVVVPRLREDHRPECKQAWVAASGGEGLRQAQAERTSPVRAEPVEAPLGSDADALYPSWVLPQPLRLRMQGETPLYGGPLHRLARLYRVETAWWEPAGAALRDYFLARSPQAGLVWIYRERPRELAGELASSHARFKWYLQGLYA
jgi:protein ImuB